MSSHLAAGMYDNALLLFTSDNGGPVYFGGNSGANNFPLRARASAIQPALPARRRWSIFGQIGRAHV